MLNIHAYRTTYRVELKRAKVDTIGPENDYWLQETAREAGIVIAAWEITGSFWSGVKRSGECCRNYII